MPLPPPKSSPPAIVPRYAASKYDESDEMLFGRVNGYRERGIIEDLGITGYPVFKWWKKGETEPEPFYYVHYRYDAGGGNTDARRPKPHPPMPTNPHARPARAPCSPQRQWTPRPYADAHGE